MAALWLGTGRNGEGTQRWPSCLSAVTEAAVAGSDAEGKEAARSILQAPGVWGRERLEGAGRRSKNHLYFLILRDVAHEETEHLLQMSAVSVLCLDGRQGTERESKDQRRIGGTEPSRGCGELGGRA